MENKLNETFDVENSRALKIMMTIPETENYLGLGCGTIKGWIDKKKCPFPFVKLGASVRFRIADVNKYIEKHLINQLEVKKETKKRGRPTKVKDLAKEMIR